MATGVKADFSLIKGATEALEDLNSPVGSAYKKEYAEKMARISTNFKGGNFVFTEPPSSLIIYLFYRIKKKYIHIYIYILYYSRACKMPRSLTQSCFPDRRTSAQKRYSLIFRPSFLYFKGCGIWCRKIQQSIRRNTQPKKCLSALQA